MNILIVSDSHGNDQKLQSLYKQYPNMDLYLHAGDSQSMSAAILPFDSIRGNCDYYDFDAKRLIYTPRGYLLMKHFPNLSAKEMKDIKFFIHGHTHRYKIETQGDVLIICPGSISYPRDDSLGSYAILKIEEDKVEVTIYELETKNILCTRKL